MHVFMGNAAWSLYGKGLASACLAIGKDRAIVALKALINHGFPYYLEDFFLRDILASYIVKSEAFLFCLSLGWQVYVLLLFDLRDASSLLMLQVKNRHVILMIHG